MMMTDEIARTWRARLAESKLDRAPRCSSCCHLGLHTLGPNGSHTTPDGRCTLLDAEVDHAEIRTCPGWQGAIYARRENVGRARSSKPPQPPWLKAVRDELAKRAPSIKRLRRLLGER